MFVRNFAESHPENSVVPLEIYASDMEITLNWIHVEEVMADPPGLVVLEVVDNDGVSVDVKDVSESFIAPARHHINKLSAILEFN